MFAILLAAAATVGVAPAAPENLDWARKVHPRVLEASSDGPAEFLLMLDERPDLAPARKLHDKAARGQLVCERLQETAERSQAGLRRLLDEAGAEYRPFWIANMIWVRGERNLLATLAARQEVVRVAANPRVSIEVVESDPPALEPGGLFPPEWNLTQVNADQVWALGYTGTGVVVGGQDTGYEWDHPALIDKYRGSGGLNTVHAYNWHDAIHEPGSDCGADSPVPCDDNNHGTHTMGTIVGDDGASNRIGMAPGARWIACRNMNEGNGTPASYSECFQWFVAPTDLADQNPDPSRAPHVINNSWACPPSEGCDVDSLRTVVENTRAAGIVVVASAGNTGSACESVVYPPAIYDAAFSVGATNSVDEVAGFSARGPVTVDGSQILKPDVTAPGSGVRSSIRNGAYASYSGTSMAGPHVAGLVALLLDARPDLIGQVDAVETIIRASTVPLTSTQGCGGLSSTDVPNHTYGHGRIDALQVISGDADGDGPDNLTDCRPADGSVWGAPGPVDSLLLSGGVATELSWMGPLDPGADQPAYDLLRSELAGDFSSASCLVSGGSSNSAVDPAVPGSVFFYLVRSSTACGTAIGTASTGAPRAVASCP